MQPVKETAANVAASAKSGMEKTKATVQEKVERMTAGNPTEKEMASERKQDRINQAELNKQEARQHNAVSKQAAGAGTGTGGSHTYTATGQTGQPMGVHQMSALPGHGTGTPNTAVTEGTVESHPIGTATGTAARSTVAHNTRAGGGTTGHGTGGGYTG